MLKLRKYQQDDAKFLASLPSSACFNEQRTGKTPTALEIIRLRKLQNEKVLIITTASSLYQWQKEYNKWLKKPCEVCDGTLNKKKQIISDWINGLVVSIDSFKETTRSNGLVNIILKENPKMVILDEAHKIKNPKSANARALFKTSKIPYKLALTATPAHGKPYDVYSILKFLFPSDFKGFWKFIDTYFIIKDEEVYQKGSKRTFKTYEEFKPGKKKELQNLLASFSTQRKRKDVMPWLPDKYYEQIKLNLTPKQKKYIEELKKTFSVGEIETSNVLSRLLRERQICLSPAILDLEGTSPKINWIKQYIKDNPDEQIIIFSKFTGFLQLISEEIDTTWAMIIGETPKQKREQFKTDFQNNKFQILLLQIDTAKEALTLDAADTTIFTDKYPPIGDIEQAEDRFIASTKDKANKSHKIIELMMRDTFDEQIYSLLEQRKSETDIINNYKKYLERKTK